MKRFKFISIMMILVAFLFCGATHANAAVSIPKEFTTDAEGTAVLNYIKYTTSSGQSEDYALYSKKAKDGTYVYCIDLTKKYKGDKHYTKVGKMDVGINYILTHKPNTGDKLKDFYITQMAIYFYQDTLNGNNDNLSVEFKKLIVAGAKMTNPDLDATTIDVCKAIYNLWLDAKHYKESYVQKIGFINIKTKDITFTEKDGYYVSSKIEVEYGNLNNGIKEALVNGTKNTKVIKDTKDGSYTIKVPVSDIPAGNKVTFTLQFTGVYSEEGAYYYYSEDSLQRLVYDKLEVVDHDVIAKVQLTVNNDRRPVRISKTDVTQQNEIPGATLVLKDVNGNVVEQWVSTTVSHKVELLPGEYSLTETIAPEGYKLSTTTIYFKVDANGKLYAKVNDTYVSVDKINMINELKDVTPIVKKDKVTDKYVAGAVLVIRDSKGNVVQEFTSNDSVYQLVLQPGEYTLEEKSAPKGYILSNEKVSFKVLINGALQVKNSNGVYEDSVMVEFYNSPEQEVPVPPTGANGMIFVIAGITLLISGVAYAIKTTKEC